MKPILIVAAAMLASAPVLAQRIPLPGIPLPPVASGGPGFPGAPQGIPGTPREMQAMLASLEAAQAGARLPGDETLSCEKLHRQLGETMKDPAIKAHFASAAAQAQAMQGGAPPRTQSQTATMAQLAAIMPKLARSQRLVELAVLKSCEWLAASDFALASMPGAPLLQADPER